MKRSTYIWSLLVGCVAFATSCDLTEDVQVKADKSMIFGSKSGLELYSNSFYKALPTLKNGFMQDKMCDVGAVSNTDTFIKQGAYNTETATSWSWGALKNVNYFIDGCNDFGDSLIFSCCYNSPFKGKYTVMDAFPTAGAMLEWYCKNILDDPSADMGELIAKVPLDGKNRVLFLPYVENFHGAVAGMSLSTTRQDLFESLLESLAFQFVHCIEYIQSTSPIKFEKLHFGGGGSRSDKLLQLRADLIGQPLGRMHNIELPSLGACMLAGLGNGFYKDVPDAAKHLVGKATYFMPDAENGKRYHQKYEQYKALSAAYLRGF